MTSREDSLPGTGDAPREPFPDALPDVLPDTLVSALVRAAGADRLLVASDFDGTLSAIVADHDAAAADPRALEPLIALASLPRTDVVVISGRARSDLAARLGSASSEVPLIGSHGAEPAVETGDGAATATADRAATADGGEGSTDAERADAERTDPERAAGERTEVERYEAALADLVRETPGVSLERKPFSLALHYRNVAEGRQEQVRVAAIERVASMAAAVQEGKKVVEFFVAEADKGTALERHREALRRDRGTDDVVCLFVGDDVTDEAAFERLEPPDVTVKVGPGETAAAHALSDRAEVASLLRRLHRLRAAATEGGNVDPTGDPRGSGT